VTGLKYTEPENEVLCVDMQLGAGVRRKSAKMCGNDFCDLLVIIIIESCVLDNTLQKLVGPIFVCFDNTFFDREEVFSRS